MAPPMTFKGFMDLQGGGAKKPSAAKPSLQAPPILPLPTQGAKLPGGFGVAMPPATTATDVLNILTQLAGTPIAASPPPALARPPMPAPRLIPPPPARPPTPIPRLGTIPLPTQGADIRHAYLPPTGAGVYPTAWGSDVEQVWSLTGYEPATPPPNIPYPTPGAAGPWMLPQSFPAPPPTAPTPGMPPDIPYPTIPPPRLPWELPVPFIPGTPRPRVLAAANPLLPPPAPRGTATGWLTLGSPPPRAPRWHILPDRVDARRVSPKWDPVDVVPWRASPTGTPPLLRQPPRRE